MERFSASTGDGITASSRDFSGIGLEVVLFALTPSPSPDSAIFTSDPTTGSLLLASLVVSKAQQENNFKIF